MEWNTEFEATPSDLIKVNDEDHSGEDSGDKTIRELKEAFSEKFSIEHSIEDGSHSLGKVSGVFIGTTLEIDELYSLNLLPTGSLAYDITLKVFKTYNGTNWIVGTNNHSNALNLSSDTHSQYLHVSKSGQTISKNISITSGRTIDRVDIEVDKRRLKSYILKDTTKIELTFVSGSKEIRRSLGSFIDNGFIVGDVIYTTSSSNPGPFIIKTVSATYIVVEGTISNETIIAAVVSYRRGFNNTEVTSFALGTTYGPEYRDCIVFVRTSVPGSGPAIWIYSDTLATPTTIITGRTNCSAIWAPIRKGSNWRVAASFIVSGGLFPPTMPTFYIKRVPWYS